MKKNPLVHQLKNAAVALYALSPSKVFCKLYKLDKNTTRVIFCSESVTEKGVNLNSQLLLANRNSTRAAYTDLGMGEDVFPPSHRGRTNGLGYGSQQE